MPYSSTSINFGCPRTGNVPWRDWVNIRRRDDVTVWRCVLGRDLVPRLPALFQHVGHTVQFTEEQTSANATTTTTAYYHHWGNATLGYAGVPSGWSATPYVRRQVTMTPVLCAPETIACTVSHMSTLFLTTYTYIGMGPWCFALPPHDTVPQVSGRNARVDRGF